MDSMRGLSAVGLSKIIIPVHCTFLLWDSVTGTPQVVWVLWKVATLSIDCDNHMSFATPPDSCCLALGWISLELVRWTKGHVLYSFSRRCLVAGWWLRTDLQSTVGTQCKTASLCWFRWIGGVLGVLGLFGTPILWGWIWRTSSWQCISCWGVLTWVEAFRNTAEQEYHVFLCFFCRMNRSRYLSEMMNLAGVKLSVSWPYTAQIVWPLFQTIRSSSMQPKPKGAQAKLLLHSCFIVAMYIYIFILYRVKRIRMIISEFYSKRRDTSKENDKRM